jgi:tRNA pseudouridine55 synthase
MPEVNRLAERGPNGVLVLRKPPGPTSHDMVGLVRRLSGVRRVGHGGTLDPFAAGVLPIFVGLATRVVEYRMGDDKAYRATVCFGAGSTTDDRDGELTPGSGPAPTREAVEQSLAAFRGRIEQRPPAFSALKIGGRRAYQLAREGKAPELAPRAVTISRLELVEWDGSDPDRPTADLEVECGAGTYIRSLARDLGERLGCGAYLGSLTRTRSGPFGLDEAIDPDELRAAAARGPEALAALLKPIDAGLESIPTLTLDDKELLAAARGQQVKPAKRPPLGQGAALRLLDGGGALVGMGSWRGGRVVPEKMLVVPSGPSSARQAIGQAVTLSGVERLSPDVGRLYVAVGVFDGLHLGHAHLLGELRRVAAEAGARPAVITFDAHPEEIVAGLAPPLLCDPEERLARLAAAGVEVTVVQHFDHALRTTTYRDFVALIRDRVDLAGFAMTADAAFGYERAGTPAALAEFGAEAGFEVTVVESLLLDGEQVRSSEIRRRIAAGDLGAAARMLGRPAAVTGRVAEAGGGTARVDFDVPVVLPPAGAYRVSLGRAWTSRGAQAGQGKAAAAVIGTGGTVVLEGPSRSLPRLGERVRVAFAADAADEPAP